MSNRASDARAARVTRDAREGRAWRRAGSSACGKLERCLWVLGLLAVLGGVACASSTSDETDDTPTPNPENPNDGGASTASLTIAFDARMGDEAAACGQTYDNIGATSVRASLADARIMLSGLALQQRDGDWVDVELAESIWQKDGVALLDFEDSTGACSGSGNPETNTVMEGVVPVPAAEHAADEAHFVALRFDVGLPFEQNHINNALAEGPLAAPGMFWNWRAGYKFLRVDWSVESDDEVDDGDGPAASPPSRWNVHLGSVECQAPTPQEAPEAACGFTNKPQITLPISRPSNGDAPSMALNLSAVVDLAALVQGSALDEDVPETAPGCMSGRNEEADCAAVFDSLGLDFATGACEGTCDGQGVFRLE